MSELNEIKVIKETPAFTVVQDEKGKYRKVMNYDKFTTYVPETQKEKVEFFNLMNDDTNENVIPMKQAIGVPIDIINVITNPYDSIDEDTGVEIHGVTTMLQDKDSKKWFVTSSKAVYYTVQNLIAAFGAPNTPSFAGLKVGITSKRQQKGDQINITLVG